MEVTFAPTVVTDGQPVTITIKAAPPLAVVIAEAHLCRAGVNYQPSTDRTYAPDFAVNGMNCPREPVSTSADSVIVNNETIRNAGTPEGESFLFRAGAGVVNWTGPGGAQVSLKCDVDNPCALVVEVRVSEPDKPPVWQPFVQTLTYASDDPFAGCGGAAPGVLSTGASDRMTDAWINWTIGECTQPGRTGAAGRASFAGEGSAMEGFDRETLDLAYTAGGYNSDIGLVAPEPSEPDGGHRSAVIMPTGLNATVLAVAGGQSISGRKIPYRDVRLKAEEVAGLLGGGFDGVGPYLEAIFDRNPEIKASGFFDLSAGFLVGAYADAESTSWYGTRYLKALAPAAWKVPDRSTFNVADRARLRGIHTALGLADPSFANAITLQSGRSVLRKNLFGSAGTSGGVWVLTDLATAKVLGLTTVSIENDRGDFVAPTPETMLAALPKMTADANGILVSDPKVVAPIGQVQPYPMTFVEYAMAPAEPLLDFECAPRTQSQGLLTGWLKYITGPGQAKLPAGMVPLTDDLRTQAASAITKVGAAPVTGPCKDSLKTAAADQAPATTTTTVPAKVTTTTTTTVPAAIADAAGVTPGATPPPSADGGTQSGSSPSPSAPGPGVATSPTAISRSKSSSAGGRTAAAPTGATETAAPTASPTPAVAFTPAKAPIDLPPFQGKNAVALGGTVLALAGIMVINAVAGLGSSPALARVRRVLRLNGPAVGEPLAPND